MKKGERTCLLWSSKCKFSLLAPSLRKQLVLVHSVFLSSFSLNLLPQTRSLSHWLRYLIFILNNRVFLWSNYRLIVALRKSDVLKTNVSPRSEASRVNMLVLRTSNFQGATIRPIVPRHKHSIVFIAHQYIFFHALVQKSVRLQLKVECKIWKRKKTNPLNTI